MSTELLSETTSIDSAVEAEPVEVAQDVLVDDELLVEEISIDGMCGVY